MPHKTLEAQRIWSRQNYKANPDRLKHNTLRWAERNPEHARNIWNAAARRRNAKLKHEVITAYGGYCACCGEIELGFLTLDHSKGDGKTHRRIVGGSGMRIYQDLRNRGYPKDMGIRVLCWNCNAATRYGRPCPHEVAVNRAIYQPGLS